ncbi:hypothetical protein DL770_010162 [Monosporascus sp. CRB-9-2]|nr:hypothetical protein DL770_010162 [Monosporascus sp. CRB-9-2]
MPPDSIDLNQSGRLGQGSKPSGDPNDRPPYCVSHLSHNVCAGLPAGNLNLYSIGPLDLVGGAFADPDSLANSLPTWSFDGSIDDDPSIFRTNFEMDMHANESTSVRDKAATESSESGGKEGSLKACPNSDCTFRAKTNRDVERHHLAVHERKALFFCEHQGCKRKGGWSRKDLRDRHVKIVHGRQRNLPLRSVTRTSTILSPRPESAGWQPLKPKEPAGAEAESLSREEALRQLYEERRMRLGVENRLQALRKDYEERDCMLLKILAGKVNLSQE